LGGLEIGFPFSHIGKVMRKDLTRNGNINEKRNISVAVISVGPDSLVGDGSVFAVLPAYFLLRKVDLIIHSKADTLGDTVSLNVGAFTASNWLVDSTSPPILSIFNYAIHKKVWGDANFTSKGGSGDTLVGFTGTYVIQYIEIDKTTGKFTRF